MNALRQRDSQFKKKNPEWSGQDVLERKPGRKQLIDNEKALWVVKHLNNIREELACCTTGMSTDMRWKFNFVKIACNALQDITQTIIMTY